MKLLSNSEYNRLQAAIAERVNYISEREYKYLQGEVKYWRERYETERDRTDRAVDSLVQNAGAIPISDAGVKEFKTKKSAVDALFEKHQRETNEIYNDTMANFDDAESADVMYESDPEKIEITE